VLQRITLKLLRTVIAVLFAVINGSGENKMSRNSGAMLPEDATEEQIEEMRRQVRDLVNYLAKYDNPKFNEQLGIIRNPEAVMVLIQSGRKYERGSGTGVHIVVVGSFNPMAVATAVRDFLVESEESALIGKEM